MPNFDFLLNITLKILGLAPIFSSKRIYLRYASFIYTTVVFFIVICGEIYYVFNVYFKNVYSDIMSVGGVTKYTYFVRDSLGILCASANLIGTQVLYKARNRAVTKIKQIDDVLKFKMKRLRNSIAFFIIYFTLWILVSLMNVVLMKPQSFPRLLSMAVGTIEAFTTIDFSEKIYLRFSEINLQLESLLDECKEINKIKDKSTELSDIQKIQALGECHVELCQIVDEMRGTYGYSMISVLVLIIINTISFSVYCLVGGLNEKNADVGIRYALWMLLYVVLAYFLLYKGTQLTDEALTTRNIILNNLRLPLEPAIVSELEILALKTEHQKYGIDCGYFELSLDTFGAMANSILTQVVIVYTFQP